MNDINFHITLANSYIKLADEHYLNNKLDESLRYYQIFNNILEMLYKNYRNNENIKKDLIKSFSKLGKIYIKLKNYKKALEYYTKANSFKKKLYNSNINSKELKNSLANSFYNLGIVYLYLKENKNSYLNFQESGKLFEELIKNYPNNISYLESLNDTTKFLKKIKSLNKKNIKSKTEKNSIIQEVTKKKTKKDFDIFFKIESILKKVNIKNIANKDLKKIKIALKKIDIKNIDESLLISIYDLIENMDITDYNLLEIIGDFCKTNNFFKCAKLFYKKSVELGAPSYKKIKSINKILADINESKIITSSDILENKSTIDDMTLEEINIVHSQSGFWTLGKLYKRSKRYIEAIEFYQKEIENITNLYIDKVEDYYPVVYGGDNPPTLKDLEFAKLQVKESMLEIASIYDILAKKYYKLSNNVIFQRKNDFIIQLYKKGLTLKKIQSIIEINFEGTTSLLEISQIIKKFERDITKWKNQKLNEKYYVVYIDTIYLEKKKDKTFYIIMGINENFLAEIITIYNRPTWKTNFENMKERGIKEIKLIVADERLNIKNDALKIFNKSKFQYSVEHKRKEIFYKVRVIKNKDDKKSILEDLNEIFKTSFVNIYTGMKYTKDNAKKELNLFFKKWDRYPKLKELFMDIDSLFTYLDFPPLIQSNIWRSDWINKNKYIEKKIKALVSIDNIELTTKMIILIMIETNITLYDHGKFYIISYENRKILKKLCEKQGNIRIK